GAAPSVRTRDVAHLEQGRAAAGGTVGRLLGGHVSSGCQQAYPPVSSPLVSSPLHGGVRTQCSLALWHRFRNTQPSGKSPAAGTVPGIVGSPVAWSEPARSAACSRPRV